MHDVIEYLITMYSPPGERIQFYDGVPSADELVATGDLSSTGMVIKCAKGEPTTAQSTELMRILLPGAHLVLIPSDEQPTGHTAVCNIEDSGFTIRDAICWANKKGDGRYLHYVGKPVRSQREAGCFGLPTKKGFETLNRKEGSAGTNNPAAGVNRTAGDTSNTHPTVKPIGLMEKLLADVPIDSGPVVDHFMGSGTTAIACLSTGHNFIGIDNEREYVAIANARVNHWRHTKLRGDRWDGCAIECDCAQPNAVSAKVKSSIEDMFGR